MLEITSEALLDIGALNTGKAYADSLCLEITRGLSGQELFVFARETLESEDFQKPRAFRVTHYPLLFAAIMSNRDSKAQCMIPWSRSLNGIILLAYATPCCADCLRFLQKRHHRQAEIGENAGSWKVGLRPDMVMEKLSSLLSEQARNDLRRIHVYWQLVFNKYMTWYKDTGHDPSEFYEGGLEKGGFSKLKVRRRAGGGGGRTNIEGLRRGLKGRLPDKPPLKPRNLQRKLEKA